MHRQQAVETLHQPVIRVGQWAVSGNAGRAAGRQQQGKTRMFGNPETPPQRVLAQPVDRQRHQPPALKLEQGHGVTRQQSLHGFKQTAVTFAVRQFAGQIIDQWNQRLQHRLCNQIDSFKYLIDYFTPVSF